jgi:SPP1 gp7 family putative phage head morphogenesis protein
MTAEEAVAALDLSGWSDLAATIESTLQGAASYGADETISSIGVDLPGGSSEIDSWEIGKSYARDRGAEMVGMKWVDDELVPNPDAKWQITEGTRDMLRSTVERGIDEGLTTDELASEIQDSHAFSDSRSKMIARTEIRMAQMGGQHGAAVAMGATHKYWSTSKDDNVSEECKGNALDGIIKIDQSFSSGDEAPPAHPNCRCVVNYLIGENEE